MQISLLILLISSFTYSTCRALSEEKALKEIEYIKKFNKEKNFDNFFYSHVVKPYFMGQMIYKHFIRGNKLIVARDVGEFYNDMLSSRKQRFIKATCGYNDEEVFPYIYANTVYVNEASSFGREFIYHEFDLEDLLSKKDCTGDYIFHTRGDFLPLELFSVPVEELKNALKRLILKYLN